MTNLSLEIKGLDAVIKKAGKGADEIIKAITREVAEQVREKIAATPPRVHYPFVWRSAKERAAYLASRKGLGPWVRQHSRGSERLESSWATEQKGLSAIVGTRVSYAPYVQSHEQQHPGHKATGWKTDKEVVDEMKRSRAAERTLDDMTRKW